MMNGTSDSCAKINESQIWNLLRQERIECEIWGLGRSIGSGESKDDRVLKKARFLRIGRTFIPLETVWTIALLNSAIDHEMANCLALN
jgi:hypothetical protein